MKEVTTHPSHTPASQTARILRLLKGQGSATNAELNRIAFRYSARIAELRREGHDILTERISRGVWRFTYRPAESDNGQGRAA